MPAARPAAPLSVLPQGHATSGLCLEPLRTCFFYVLFLSASPGSVLQARLWPRREPAATASRPLCAPALFPISCYQRVRVFSCVKLSGDERSGAGSHAKGRARSPPASLPPSPRPLRTVTVSSRPAWPFAAEPALPSRPAHSSFMGPEGASSKAKTERPAHPPQR